MSKLISGKEYCEKCNKPYIAALGGKSCECMKVYSEATGYKCYKNPLNKKWCDARNCPDADTCNFGQWQINGDVDLKENNND